MARHMAPRGKPPVYNTHTYVSRLSVTLSGIWLGSHGEHRSIFSPTRDATWILSPGRKGRSLPSIHVCNTRHPFLVSLSLLRLPTAISQHGPMIRVRWTRALTRTRWQTLRQHRIKTCCYHTRTHILNAHMPYYLHRYLVTRVDHMNTVYLSIHTYMIYVQSSMPEHRYVYDVHIVGTACM